MVFNKDYVNLLGKVEQKDYLLQLREAIKPGFPNGEYPFVFPGGCSLFGGAIEPGESPEQAFRREMAEELPDLALPPRLEMKTVNWVKQAEEIFNKINESYQGNLESFLGFTLDVPVPSSALGEYRRQGTMTYREWLSYTGHYFRLDLSPNIIPRLKDQEGAGAVLVPATIIKNITMEPGDKLVILEDLVDQAIRVGKPLI
jgi:hypothetical protein